MKKNIITSMEFYDWYIIVTVLYMLASVSISLITLLHSFKHGTNKRHTAIIMLIFTGLVFAMQLLQALSLGFDSDYVSLGLAWAVSLIYLTTNMNMDTLIDNRTRAAAVQADLDIASKIQTNSLPKVFPPYEHHTEIELYASMDTAKEVGGDFYDCFEIDDRRVCFVMADVSGKGVPAALFMMTAKTMIKDYALTKDSTAEIFTAVNARLCENNEAGMFATAWIGILDTRTMTLQFTNAGHNYPVLIRKDQPCEEMKNVHGLFLGGMEFTRYKQNELKLYPGDRLLLFTDGVVEAHDRTNALYGIERLENVLDSTRELPGEKVLDRIFTDVNIFAAEVPQFDDITMVVLTIEEPEGAELNG